MKRVVSFVTVLLICFTLAIPAFASEVGFVPSITAKPAPEVKHETTDANGVPIIEIKNIGRDVVFSAPIKDLMVTSVADVMADNGDLAISEEAAQVLKTVYEELNKDGANLANVAPEVAKAAEAVDVKTSEMVVVDLFDVSTQNEELQQYLNEDGHTVDLTFTTNVAPDQHVFVMVYKDNEWQLVEGVVNNGDGTITCTFEFLGPVAILTAPMAVEENESATEALDAEDPDTDAPDVDAPDADAPAETTEESEGGFNMWLIVLAIVAVILFFLIGKKRKDKEETKETV